MRGTMIAGASDLPVFGCQKLRHGRWWQGQASWQMVRIKHGSLQQTRTNFPRTGDGDDSTE
jgi:hypothetical protein